MTSIDDPPLLFPPVRSCERLAGRVTLAEPVPIIGRLDASAARAALGADVRMADETSPPTGAVQIRIDRAGIRDHAYRLRARAECGGVEIESCGVAGALHALSTLRQMLRQYGRTLPALAIDDFPLFRGRGVMLDVSRDRVPTMPELLRLVDQFAELKINHLQLYTEHTFAYAGHEEVWRGWSPVTPAEVRELDAYCRLRGVTLAANQNCFGHLASWLRHPRYAPLAEIQGADTLWKFYDFDRRGPFSLCPTDPGSIALVRDLLGQLVPCFSGGVVNINCDETADVGQGRSRESVSRRGAASVYFEFIRAVADIARSLGARPMFWADIALSHPEAVGLIPEDMIALAWGYEPDAPFGEWCGRLRGAGREAWVCPGTSSWRSITGRTSERRANVTGAAREGLAAGAAGLLITDWGDVGHRQQWPVSLHGIAHGAHAGWAGDRLDPPSNAESLQVFGDRSLSLARWLDDLGDVDVALRRVGGRRGSDGSTSPLRNATVLFNDLHPPFDGADRVGSEEDWRLIHERLSGIRSAPIPSVDPAIKDELLHTLDVAQFVAERAVWRRAPGRSGAGARLAERLRSITSEHRRLWARRSRPGGLESSCGHYLGLLAGLSDR